MWGGGKFSYFDEGGETPELRGKKGRRKGSSQRQQKNQRNGKKTSLGCRSKNLPKEDQKGKRRQQGEKKKKSRKRGKAARGQNDALLSGDKESGKGRAKRAAKGMFPVYGIKGWGKIGGDRTKGGSVKKKGSGKKRPKWGVGGEIPGKGRRGWDSGWGERFCRLKRSVVMKRW